jgi:hypothetical protein
MIERQFLKYGKGIGENVSRAAKCSFGISLD